MPDWFYRTVSQPLLFRLPAPRARDLALGFMGRLSRLPFGPFLIDFLGHMRADPRLRKPFFDIEFPTAVGLGPWLDTHAVATEALSRFGVGFIEIGPVTLNGSVAAKQLRLLKKDQALWIDDEPDSISLAECNRRLRRVEVPVIVRIAASDNEEIAHLIRELDPSARLIVLNAQHLECSDLTPLWSDQASSITKRRQAAALQGVASGAAVANRHVLLCVPVDADFENLTPLLDEALDRCVAGLVIDGSIKTTPTGRLIGLPAREQALQLLRSLRERYDVPIIASGGIHEPEHALEFLASGASLVQVDTGLIYTGPGLPKRINDCLLFEATRNAAPADPPPRPAELTWFWTTLMGAGMMIGGVLALVIAATKVVLPYDEAFLGMSINDLIAINPRLLAFMAHDRITLAGVMVAIGILYVVLSVFGMRRGLHWARQSVLISAFTGFASFFLFLGFGYLDTFHAFVTAALLQLLLLGVHARLGVYVPASRPDLRGDGAWRLGLWGQLLLVIHGFALLAAGIAISMIGITEVFVREDLEFLGTTAAALSTANPRLVPLVAHDRATLGGMLLASGWMFLLPALWGYRRNSPWLWWSLLIAGSIAYIAATSVHHAVGYLNVKHLLPAFGGYALMLVGLILSYPFLCGKVVRE
jgi:dihydroorotate dehydrogenase